MINMQWHIWYMSRKIWKVKKTNISDTPNLKYSINWALLKCKDILYQLKTSIFSKKKTC